MLRGPSGLLEVCRIDPLFVVKNMIKDASCEAQLKALIAFAREMEHDAYEEHFKGALARIRKGSPP